MRRASGSVALLTLTLVLTSPLVSGCQPAAAGQADQPAAAPTPAPTGTSGSPSAAPASRSSAGDASTAPPLRTIVIDPGHSGRTIRSTDTTGLHDIDYPNYPEIYEMFDVSACVATALRSDGYRVLLTKKHALSSVSHRQRATIANRAKADLAISVHDDHGVGPHFEATYSQLGARRSNGSYPAMYRGTGKHRTVFHLPTVARRSDRAARALAVAREGTQHRPVAVTQNSYNGREPLEPGNLALVQLFSQVPWVYNEMGALTGTSTTRAMSIASEQKYAAGLLLGVEAAVPLTAGRTNAPTRSASGLTRCLRRQVEPSPGKLSRPKRYLPAGF